MRGRVEGKIGIVIGGGQTPGDTIGNGRATAILLAREGAKIIVADQDPLSGQETVDMVTAEGNEAQFELVDATQEESIRMLVMRVKQSYGSIDILHNNVGASLALGDAAAIDLTEEAFDRSFAVNLKSHWMACKHVIPIMREQGCGSIVNISSDLG